MKRYYCIFTRDDESLVFKYRSAIFFLFFAKLEVMIVKSVKACMENFTNWRSSRFDFTLPNLHVYHEPTYKIIIQSKSLRVSLTWCFPTVQTNLREGRQQHTVEQNRHIWNPCVVSIVSPVCRKYCPYSSNLKSSNANTQCSFKCRGTMQGV